MREEYNEATIILNAKQTNIRGYNVIIEQAGQKCKNSIAKNNVFRNNALNKLSEEVATREKQIYEKYDESVRDANNRKESSCNNQIINMIDMLKNKTTRSPTEEEFFSCYTNIRAEMEKLRVEVVNEVRSHNKHNEYYANRDFFRNETTNTADKYGYYFDPEATNDGEFADDDDGAYVRDEDEFADDVSGTDLIDIIDDIVWDDCEEFKNELIQKTFQSGKLDFGRLQTILRRTNAELFIPIDLKYGEEIASALALKNSELEKLASFRRDRTTEINAKYDEIIQKRELEFANTRADAERNINEINKAWQEHIDAEYALPMRNNQYNQQHETETENQMLRDQIQQMNATMQQMQAQLNKLSK